MLAGVGALAIAPFEIAAGGAKAIWDSSKPTYRPEYVIIWIDGIRIDPNGYSLEENWTLRDYPYLNRLLQEQKS